jgi:hypothetical protein
LENINVALSQSPHPTTFLFSIGGYMGPSSNIELGSTELICHITGSGLAGLRGIFMVSVEDDPDWESLVKFIRKLKWEPTYYLEACDGTNWEFEYADSDFSLKSGGSNAYPKNFRQFLKLLNKVLAKHGVPEVS